MGALHSPGRRRFVQLLGWAGVATMARGGPALAQAASKSRGTSRPDSTAATPPAVAPGASPAADAGPSAEARALGEVVRQRYGDKLSAEEIATITKDLDGDLAGIKRLRETRLANSDEPDFTFHA